jgi:uncharacterized protein YndB with AHSA1/START domain
MSTVAVTRVVPVPVARAWTVFTDLPARARWLSTVADVEVLTTGSFGVGTTWRETRAMPDGELVTEEFRVEECSAPARLVLSSPGAGMDYRIAYAFVPIWSRAATVRRWPPRACRPLTSGATAVTVVLDGTASGSAGRLLAFLLGGLAAGAVEGTLRQDLTDFAAAAA